MRMTVRDLIERLAHLEDDAEIMTKNYSHTSDSTTLNFVDVSDCYVEEFFTDGKNKLVVVIG